MTTAGKSLLAPFVNHSLMFQPAASCLHTAPFPPVHIWVCRCVCKCFCVGGGGWALNKPVCHQREGGNCATTVMGMFSQGPQSLHVVSSSLLDSVKGSWSRIGSELKREAQCFCFPSFGLWRATTVLRLSHSLLLVTAFLCFCLDPCVSQIIHLTLLFFPLQTQTKNV